MFRCRYDNICIHPHNVCDGVVHCRHSQDDESLCEAHCPYRCTCAGLTAVCNSTTHKKTHDHYSLLGLKVAQPRVDFSNLIHSCTSLLILYIEHTVVTIVDVIAINNNQMLYMLTLNDNNMENIPSNSFNKLTHLRHLEIHHNFLTILEKNIFQGLNNLQVLNLSGLAVEKLKVCCLCGMITLIKIDLSNNDIKVLRLGMLLTTKPVDVIDLSNNNITFIQQFIFNTYFKTVLFTKPAYFCLLIDSNRDLAAKNRSSYICDQLLMDSTYLSIFVSITVLLLIINASVVLQHISHKVHFIFILHLAFADMFYVLYLITIAGAHFYYREQFPIHRQHWMLSTTCKASMIMFIISMCQSKCVTIFININYLQGTKYVMERRPFSKRKTYTILICLWTISLLLSSVVSIFSVNTSQLCVQPMAQSFQHKSFISIIGYTSHILLSLVNMYLLVYTYISIIKCIQLMAKKTNRVTDSKIKIKVLCSKALILTVSSFFCDSWLASLPLFNNIVLMKVEIYMILIAITQKCLTDSFVYTYMNKIRQQIK